MLKVPVSRLRDLWVSFWALPILYLAASVALFAAALWLDRNGLSARLAGSDWPISISGDTALETIATVTAVIVSLLALFFSITLIVITMAASNLGVRLIDRWVGDRSIRVTLSLLLGLLAYAVLLQAATDPAGPDERLPRFTLFVLVLALIVSLAWLAKAFDHLSRRIHVDTSIAELGRDVARSLDRLADLSAPTQSETDWSGARTVESRRSGYVDGVDLKQLVGTACRHGLVIRLRRAQGDYIHRGDVLFDVHGGPEGLDEDLARHVDVAPYRSDAAGAMFETALLAEIAARALSPAVNDVYTALACIDRLGGGMADAFARQQGAGWFGHDGDRARVFVPHLTPCNILRRPLHILRQAGAAYPSASIRLLNMLERLIRHARMTRDRDWLAAQARLVAEGAMKESLVEADRADIEAALRRALSAQREDAAGAASTSSA